MASSMGLSRPLKDALGEQGLRLLGAPLRERAARDGTPPCCRSPCECRGMWTPTWASSTAQASSAGPAPPPMCQAPLTAAANKAAGGARWRCQGRGPSWHSPDWNGNPHRRLESAWPKRRSPGLARGWQCFSQPCPMHTTCAITSNGSQPSRMGIGCRAAFQVVAEHRCLCWPWAVAGEMAAHNPAPARLRDSRTGRSGTGKPSTSTGPGPRTPQRAAPSGWPPR